MHRALWKLLVLRFRGAVRRVWRGLKTPRGAVFFVFTASMIGLWLGPMVFFGLFATGREAEAAHGAISGTFGEMMPIGLLAITLMSLLGSSKRSVHFTPAEVDFLFAGPFSRRQLLFYKIVANGFGAVVTAAFFTLFFLQAASLAVAAFVGLFLTILFMQLVGMAVVLAGQTVAERAYSWTRRLLVVAIVSLAVVGMYGALPSAGNLNALDYARALRDSTVGMVMLAPFNVFARAVLAETIIPDLAVWGTLALGVDLLLMAAVLWLDANYLEASVASSARFHRLMQQARSGGIVWAPRRSARWRAPRLPLMSGAGPIARRQLTTALRRAPFVIGLLLAISFAVGPVMLMFGADDGVVAPLAGLGIWFTALFLPRALPFDFRGDVDYIDWLKSMPIRAGGIAAGQLIAPVVIACAIQWSFVAGLLFLIPERWPILLAGAAFCLPIDMLVFGIENLVFLLFPSRSAFPTPGDFQSMGRSMVEFIVKMMVLLFCGAVASLFGVLAYFVAGRSPAAFALVAWIVLGATAILIVPAICWAYRRFDVSLDTPP